MLGRCRDRLDRDRQAVDLQGGLIDQRCGRRGESAVDRLRQDEQRATRRADVGLAFHRRHPLKRIGVNRRPGAGSSQEVEPGPVRLPEPRLARQDVAIAIDGDWIAGRLAGGDLVRPSIPRRRTDADGGRVGSVPHIARLGRAQRVSVPDAQVIERDDAARAGASSVDTRPHHGRAGRLQAGERADRGADPVQVAPLQAVLVSQAKLENLIDRDLVDSIKRAA